MCVLSKFEFSFKHYMDMLFSLLELLSTLLLSLYHCAIEIFQISTRQYVK
jgi:hypothetical protein